MSLNVLIVDDQRNMRITLKDILEDEGCRVVTAESGTDAVELCRRSGFDTVLMDLKMRGIDGLEAFQQMRRHDMAARVILMSAHGKEQTRREALDQGAVAFLSKPLDLDMVIRLVCRRETVLVVFVVPDPEVVRDMVSAVESKGYVAEVVQTVSEARRIASGAAPLAFVIDYRLWNYWVVGLDAETAQPDAGSRVVRLSPTRQAGEALATGRGSVPDSVVSINCSEVWELLDVLSGDGSPLDGHHTH